MHRAGCVVISAHAFSGFEKKAWTGGVQNESGELCSDTPSIHAKTQIVGAYLSRYIKVSPLRFEGICLRADALFQYVLLFNVEESATKSSANLLFFFDIRKYFCDLLLIRYDFW